jgi:phenylalanyl-tRNA synthetase beta chain
MHPGQTAAIHRDGQLLGYAGALHPSLQQSLDIPGKVYLFELTLDLLTQTTVPSFSSLSKFPEVRRDLALLLDRQLPVEQLLESVKSKAGNCLIDLKVFDVYMGKGIDPQRKSVAIGLTFQHPSRTLTEDEINASVDAVVQHLQEKYSASLR